MERGARPAVFRGNAMGKDSIYFDFRGRSNATFQFYIGARGIGKSYSVYDEIYKNSYRTDCESKWLYVRYSENEVKSSCGGTNCFEDYNYKNGTDIRMEYGDTISNIFEYVPYKSKDIEYDTRHLGYAKSLDTFAALRGISLAHVDYIFFDEFIPETTSRRKPIYNVAGKVFRNMYETISRNREVDGRDPVKCYFFGNSDSVYVDIIAQFGLMSILNKMTREGIKRFTDPKRSVYVELCEANVSNLKRDTAIYKLGGDDQFVRMALDNEFPVEQFEMIKENVPINEYIPIIQYCDISIWKHKSNGRLYARKSKSTAKATYGQTDQRKFFKDFYVQYQCAVIDKKILFDSIETKMILDTALNRNKLK